MRILHLVTAGAGSRISRLVGGRRRSPTRALFGKTYVKRKKLGPVGGGGVASKCMTAGLLNIIQNVTFVHMIKRTFVLRVLHQNMDSILSELR